MNTNEIGLDGYFISKVFTLKSYLAFTLKKNKIKKYLYISRKIGPCIIISQDKFEEGRFQNDIFIELFRSRLKDKMIKEVVFNEETSYIRLIFGKFEFLELNFLKEGTSFYISMQSTDKIEVLSSAHRGIKSKPVNDFEKSYIEYISFLSKSFNFRKLKISDDVAEIKEIILSGKSKQERELNGKLQKKRKKIEGDLINLRGKVQLAKSLIESDQISEIDLKSLKIKMQNLKNIYAVKSKLYEAQKRFNAAINIQEGRLKEATNEKSRPKTVQTERPIPLIWMKSDLAKTEQAISHEGNVRELFSDDNCRVYKGLNDIGNNYLITKIAKKEDYWAHLQSNPSAHYVIKFKSTFSQNTFLICMKVIAKDIDRQMGSLGVDITYTQIRNLKKIKSSPGKVTLARQKTIRVFPD